MGTTLAVISAENNTPTNFTMKSMLLVALFVAVATAYPQELTVEYKEPIAILRSAATVDETGKYAYSFEGANGIKLNEEGEQKRIGNEPEEIGTVSRGSYSYEMDGVTYTVNWVADENGFQPTGAHLPVAPPMPDYVVKMLAELRAAGKLEYISGPTKT